MKSVAGESVCVLLLTYTLVDALTLGDGHQEAIERHPRGGHQNLLQNIYRGRAETYIQGDTSLWGRPPESPSEHL